MSAMDFFEFFLAFKSNFQAKRICHVTTSLNAEGNNIVDKDLTLGLGNTVVLLVAFPQIQEQAEGR